MKPFVYLLAILLAFTGFAQPGPAHAACFLYDGDNVISGQVLDSKLQPIADLEIHITETSGSTCTVVTDAEGRYAFRGAPYLEYLIEPAAIPTFYATPVFQTARPGENELETFTMIEGPRDNGVYITFGRPPQDPPPRTGLQSGQDSAVVFQTRNHTYFSRVIYVGHLGELAGHVDNITIEGAFTDTKGEARDVELVDVRLDRQAHGVISGEDLNRGAFLVSFTADSKGKLDRDGYLGTAYFRVRNNGPWPPEVDNVFCLSPLDARIELDSGAVVQAHSEETCIALEIED